MKPGVWNLPERFQWTFLAAVYLARGQKNCDVKTCYIHRPIESCITISIFQPVTGKKRPAIFILKIETPNMWWLHRAGMWTESSMGGGPLSFRTPLKPEIAPIWKCEHWQVNWEHMRQPFRKKEKKRPFFFSRHIDGPFCEIKWKLF